MKKYLLALLVCVMAFAGCSKDDEGPGNPPDNTDNTKDIVIKSITFGNDDNTKTYDRNTYGVNQKVIARAVIDNPNNDNISLSWSSGSNDFGKGKELELLFGKINPSAEVTVSASDSKGNKGTLSKTFSVIECDFGFGVWNDEIEIIKDSETGAYVNNNAGVIYEFIDEGVRRFYTFSDNKLISGKTIYEYTPKVLQPTQFEIAWTLYEEKLNELITKYGNYTKQETSRNFTGNKADDGLALINGATIDTYFENAKTKIHYKVHHAQGGAATTVTYQVNYSKL